MPINPNIALSGKPLELQDPLAAYGRIAAIQQAQNQNALAQMQMDEYARARKEEEGVRNYLAGKDLAAPETLAGLYGFGKTGVDYATKLQTGQKAALDFKAAQTKLDAETYDLNRKKLNDAMTHIASLSSPEDAITSINDSLRSGAIDTDRASQLLTSINQAGPDGFQKWKRQQLTPLVSAKEQLDAMKPMSVAAGASVYDPVKGTFTQAPAAPAAPAAPTTLAKLQTERAALPPGDPRIAQYDALILKETTHAPPARTTVSLPPQEKAEQGKRGEFLVDQYKALSNAAGLASRTLPALETQERLLTEGFKTGFGTEAQKAGASVLAALGIPEASKFATDAQTFLSATQQAVLQRQLEQKGPQTEADAQRITQTGAQLGNTPEANKFMIAVAKAQLKRDIEQRNFYDKWWKTNKTYDGAEDAWFTGEGGKSLFDRPELKAFTAPAAAPTKPTAAPAASGWRVVR